MEIFEVVGNLYSPYDEVLSFLLIWQGPIPVVHIAISDQILNVCLTFPDVILFYHEHLVDKLSTWLLAFFRQVGYIWFYIMSRDFALCLGLCSVLEASRSYLFKRADYYRTVFKHLIRISFLFSVFVVRYSGDRYDPWATCFIQSL